MANPSIQPLPYGVSESATARQVALMTFDHFKNAIIEYHAVMKTGPDPQEHVFSIKHEHVEPSSSFLLLATLSTLDFPRHLLLHRPRIITCRRKFKNSRRRIRYCLVVFTNSNQEDHQVQQTHVVALQVAERVHFPPTASANLLVERGGAHRSPQQKRNFQQSSNPRPTLHPTIKKRSQHCLQCPLFP